MNNVLFHAGEPGLKPEIAECTCVEKDDHRYTGISQLGYVE